jgi:hypothetical protein
MVSATICAVSTGLKGSIHTTQTNTNKRNTGVRVRERTEGSSSCVIRG